MIVWYRLRWKVDGGGKPSASEGSVGSNPRSNSGSYRGGATVMQPLPRIPETGSSSGEQSPSKPSDKSERSSTSSGRNRFSTSGKKERNEANRSRLHEPSIIEWRGLVETIPMRLRWDTWGVIDWLAPVEILDSSNNVISSIVYDVQSNKSKNNAKKNKNLYGHRIPDSRDADKGKEQRSTALYGYIHPNPTRCGSSAGAAWPMVRATYHREPYSWTIELLKPKHWG